MKNITRFKLPVFVAAGLHGALFLSMPPAHVVVATVEQVKPIKSPPPPEEIIRITEPESECGSASAGALGREVSSLPEPIPELRDTAKFTMPVVKHEATLGLPVTLAEPPGRPDGTTDSWGQGPTSVIIGIGDLDRIPRATVQPSPDYPARLRSEGATGSVTVAFVVDREGRVVSAEALRYTHREFVEPAVRAVLKWRFEPGKHHGRPTSFRMAVPIEFGLGNE